ncbi:Protein of unknown function [Pyronema omphalodes CBS 100304]|uniref:Uncharacterized protein n=1 Tax=Pyronema omphalodes (strain CBS 100304) TaxID=1076935 RepID=U4LBJ1_PYROM|nr:Protein of unknown function [Pyronema omphalodes CBS 100304]
MKSVHRSIPTQRPPSEDCHDFRKPINGSPNAELSTRPRNWFSIRTFRVEASTNAFGKSIPSVNLVCNPPLFPTRRHILHVTFEDELLHLGPGHISVFLQ